LETNADELLTLWLAGQVYELVKKEDHAVKALKITMQTLQEKD